MKQRKKKSDEEGLSFENCSRI